MADPNQPQGQNQPPTPEELVALADSISQQISDSMGKQTQTLTNTLTSVRSTIGEVELLLKELDNSINDLLGRHTTSDGEKRQLEEEIERMKQSRFAIKDALDRLKTTYDTGIDGLEQAASAYPDVVEKINTSMKDNVNTLLSKIQDVVNQQPPANPPAGQQGGKKRRGRKHTRGKRHSRRGTKRAHKRTRKGGYNWRKKSSSGYLSKSKSKKNRK
jgi:chromosome segregation ATPase